MAVIKPDPDSDGECSPAFFHNPNDLLNLKEDEDCSFIKCAVTKFETEVNANSVNSVPDSNSEIERSVIKEETDPLLITFQDMQGKNEVLQVSRSLRRCK
jgi:hypothetical protein